MVTVADFGLGDWPPGGMSRDHAVHVAYCRAVRRAGGRLVDYVSPGEVAQRDRWACSACGGPVGQRWDADGLDGAPVMVFRVPLAEGGRYAKANMQLAHFRCAHLADPLLVKALTSALGPAGRPKVRAGKGDTHCLEGHELAGGNLLRSSDGRRRCRQCRNDRESGRTAAGTTGIRP